MNQQQQFNQKKLRGQQISLSQQKPKKSPEDHGKVFGELPAAWCKANQYKSIVSEDGQDKQDK